MWRQILLVLLILVSGCSRVAVQEEATRESRQEVFRQPADSSQNHRQEFIDHAIVKADRLVQEKQLDKAIMVLERAVKVEPDSPRLWFRLAMVASSNGQHSQAKQFARKAEVLSPPGSDLLLEIKRFLSVSG